jgi:hypothetical protein
VKFVIFVYSLSDFVNMTINIIYTGHEVAIMIGETESIRLGSYFTDIPNQCFFKGQLIWISHLCHRTF